MSPRSTAILLLLLAVVGGAYWWFDVRGAQQRQELEQREKALFSFGKAEVDALVVERADGQVSLKKVDGKWRVVAPVEAPADGAAVETLVGDLASASREDRIGPAADLAGFGLAPPAVKVTVNAKGKSHELLVGGDTATGSYAYAKRPDQTEVILVNRTLKTAVDKSLLDLRDKTILEIPVDQVQELQLVRGAETVAAKRQGTDAWSLTSPLQAAADPEAIRQLLTDLGNAKIQQFAGAGADDRARIEPVSAKLVLFIGQDRAQKSLLLGPRAPDQDGVWAARELDGERFLVPADLWDKIHKPLAELRDRRLVRFERDAVTGLEWSYPAGVIKVRKRGKGPDGQDRWQIEAPLQLKADGSAISSLLFDLEALKGEEFASATAASGLDPPQWRLTLRGPQPALEIAVGGRASTAERSLVRSAGGPVLEVRDQELERIRLDLFKLREKLLLDFRRDQLEAFEVVAGGPKLRVRRDGDQWRMEQPKSVELAEDKLNDLIWSFDYVQMEKAFEERPADLKRYGLDQPQAQVTVWTRGGTLVGQLRLGAKVHQPDSEPDSDWIYAYVEGRSPVCAVEASTLKSLREALGKLLKN